LFIESAHLYQLNYIGRNLDVLWESSHKTENGDFLVKGLTENYLKVSAIVPTDRWNIIENVHLERFFQDSVLGVVNN